MRFSKRSVNLIVLVVAFFVVVIALSFVYSEIFKAGPPLLLPLTFSQASSPLPKVSNQEIQVGELVDSFYQVVEKQDCTLFFSYFTPAKTEQEIRDYQWATGADLPEPMCRIFMRTKISEPIVQKVTKTSETNYRVEVNDKFQSWNNAEPVGWSEPLQRKMIISLVNTGSQWKIEKYFFDCSEPVCGGGNTQTDKYSGVGQ